MQTLFVIGEGFANSRRHRVHDPATCKLHRGATVKTELVSRRVPLRQFRFENLPHVEVRRQLRYPPGAKPTIEYDETRLKRVMKLTGLKSRKAALDYALREAEHAARRFFKSLLPDAEYAGAVAPGYDVLAVRETEPPYRP